MLTGIDHLVIACPDPDAAAGELERILGLRASGGGRHETLGTFNRLAWLGDDAYVELIGAWDRALAERAWIGMPTVRALDVGGGFATWALASDDVARDAEEARARGSELGEPMAGSRVRGDGRIVRWTLAAGPRLGPDEPPFLIEHDPTGAEWTPAERAERAAEVHPIGGPVRLDALVLAVPDVARAAGGFLRAVGLGPFRPSLAGRGARDAAVGRQTVRLRPAGGSGPAVEIRLRLLSGGDGPGHGAGASAGGSAGIVHDVTVFGCRWVVRSD